MYVRPLTITSAFTGGRTTLQDTPALSAAVCPCSQTPTPPHPNIFSFLSVCCARSGFALMQLCCRATALRASFLQQQPAAAVAVHTATATRGGFLGPTAATPSGRGLHARAPASAGISVFSGRSAGAPGRPTHTTTRALVAAALLLSSSSSTASAGGAPTRFAGWGGRRKGSHSTPSMAASAVASDATAGGASAVEEGALPGAASAKLPVVFVLGGPGSGKGTQCERLAKEYG